MRLRDVMGSSWAVVYYLGGFPHPGYEDGKYLFPLVILNTTCNNSGGMRADFYLTSWF